MADEELKALIKQVLAETRFFTGDGEVSLEDMALIRPRLGSLMLDVGQRSWILYYAAKAGNWRMARSQWDEIGQLMELGGLIRPRYGEHLQQFIAEDWSPVGKAIESGDFPAFKEAFHHGVRQLNAYHELEHRGFIRWKLPELPPPDYDLEPREEDRTAGQSWPGRGAGRPEA